MTRKQQGAIGVALAVAYFGSRGYSVFVPVSDFGRYDLVADIDGLRRVEVKTTTASSGNVELRTKGGNKSGDGREQRISADDCDLVFLANLNTGAQKVMDAESLAGRNCIKL